MDVSEPGRHKAERAVRSPSYDYVAFFYDLLSSGYSLGLIHRSKKAQLDYLRPGDRVLYLGVGSGEDAVMAAGRGCRVTAVDTSAQMIGRLRRRLSRRNLSAELIVGDAMGLQPSEPYDAVCGNYFFNLFDASDMPRVLAHARTLVRPGGRLMIADVAPPEGIAAPITWVYAKFALAFFWILRLTANHPLYDYRVYGREIGLEVEGVHDFGLPKLFRTVVLRRPAEAGPQPA